MFVIKVKVEDRGRRKINESVSSKTRYVKIVTSIVPMGWHIRLICASDVLAAKFSNLTVFVFISGNLLPWIEDFCSTMRWKFCCVLIIFWPWVVAASLITVFCRPPDTLCVIILWPIVPIFDDPTIADFCNAILWFCTIFWVCTTCVLDTLCCNPWCFCKLETVFCIVVAIFWRGGFCITTLLTDCCRKSPLWFTCPASFKVAVSESLVCIVGIVLIIRTLCVCLSATTCNQGTCYFRKKFIMQNMICVKLINKLDLIEIK